MIFQNPMSALNPLFRVGDQMNDVLNWAGGREGGRKIGKEQKTDKIWKALESVKVGKNKKILQMFPVSAQRRHETKSDDCHGNP